jgi:hypothetical protein
MPTKKKRHTCMHCKMKLTEDQMKHEKQHYYSYHRVWLCIDTARCNRVYEFNKSAHARS